MRLFVVLFLILSALPSWAGTFSLSTRTDHGQTILSLNNGSTEQKLGEVVTIPAGTRYYHWGPADEVERLSRQGFVDANDLEYRINNGQAMAAGGGFYVSTDPLDSMNYGPRALVVTLPHDIQALKAESPEAFKEPEVIHLLQAQGISDINFRNTWSNLISLDPVSKVHEITQKDLFETERVRAHRIGIKEFLNFDQRYPFDPSVKSSRKISRVLRYALGKSTKPLKLEPRDDSLEKALTWLFEIVRKPTPIVVGLRKHFHKEIVERAKDAEKTVESYSILLENGVRVSELSRGSKGPKLLFPDQLSLVERAFPKPEHEFGKKLSEALEFIDFDDLAAALAHGDPEPWKHYDHPNQTPLLARWERAKKMDNILDIYRTISGIPDGSYRTTPVVAGGDIHVPSEPDKGFYRVTAHQKSVLEQNPFLTLEVHDDPASPNHKTFLVRHEYPSARTYKKFENMLSPSLQEDLEKADAAGHLSDIHSDKFKSLTQRIVEELTKPNIPSKGWPFGPGNPLALSKYQALIAIHPFPDHNGRTLRALLQNAANKPLFLRDWNEDLLTNEAEFAANAAAGRGELYKIREGLVRAEHENPSFPKYYDIPEIWQVASQTPSPVAKTQEFVKKIREKYRDPKLLELIRQKRISEIIPDFQQSCDRLFENLAQ